MVHRCLKLLPLSSVAHGSQNLRDELFCNKAGFTSNLNSVILGLQDSSVGFTSTCRRANV